MGIGDGFSTKDFQDDFGRRVKGLMVKAVAEQKQPVNWDMLPQYAETPHPTFVITRSDGRKKKFSIAQEEQVLGTSDGQILEKLCGHVRLALQTNNK